ncbi:alpha/beta hydrolase [Streptomyces sp. PTM05]|uniref:Alpha/beta hydrolase n=1 Tax=Streptantibioticus parmotrematis TaxID=2873249 RepID=A0ABS7QXE2_9ACTN|nr:alpha/beta hydrolase [Streptantibioticus parmotrematis]MBY8886454.1 alpha/beta hydrolase [Streptantibioticus parmotrematis]
MRATAPTQESAGQEDSRKSGSAFPPLPDAAAWQPPPPGTAHRLLAGALPTYYERWGSGGDGERPPVLLLHGGGTGAFSWWGQAPALAERYDVHVPERRGHARTPDVDGPMSYEAMADDTAAFMAAAGLRAARVVGWSDGATVALHLALRHPELVERLVVIGGGVTREGATPAADALIHDDASRELLAGMFAPQYEPLSPDGPGHFPVVFAKLLRMWRAGTGIELADLARITVPVLVMQGDDDGVRVEHSAEMVAALPDAQLAVVPGTSHALPLEKPALVTRLLLDFLGEDREARPVKMMPLGAKAPGRG